jgi:hypothetical protein
VTEYEKVLSGSGTSTITLDRPLRDTYNGASPTVYIWSPVQQWGIQNMTIHRANLGAANVAQQELVACGAADAWVNNVTFSLDFDDGSRNHAIHLENSARVSVVNSQTLAGNWIRNGAVWIVNCIDCLVQNNYFVSSDEAVVLYDGVAGTVTAYNYNASISVSPGEQYSNTYMLHGMYPTENLEEGDTGDGHTVVADTYWGPQGPRNTYFRNERFSASVDQDGVQQGFETITQGTRYATSYLNMIGNVAGNVLQRPGCTVPINCYPIDGGLPLASAWGEKNRYIRNFSEVSPQPTTTWVGANSGLCSTNDSLCLGWFGPTVINASSGSSVSTGYPGTSPPSQWLGFNMPASFYLTSRPSWWLSAPWPAVGADVTVATACSSQGMCGSHMIPAQCRYLGSTTGECAPSNSVALGSPGQPQLLP